MMAKPVNPRKVVYSPEWVFRWRPLGSPLVPKLIALTVVGIAFVLLVTSLRIRVAMPEKMSPRRASLIYLGDDAQSRSLALRAREGGPFPSRFEPADWEGLAAIEKQMMDAARYEPPAYLPVIEELPEENLVQPLLLAPLGEAFFPIRKSSEISPPDVSGLELAPVLYPLSSIAAAALPIQLPAFEGPVDGMMAAAPWRFLACVNAEGIVTECASLEKGGELAADTLEKWLHQVRFKPQPGSADRWIALGIGFTNQPVNGPDSR